MTRLLALAAPLLLLLPLSAAAAALTVEITDVKKAEGSIHLKLCRDMACWDGKAAAVAHAELEAVVPVVRHRFADLPPGSYALMMIHDENGNGRLDTGMFGIPSEGYGYSRDPSVMRRAYFEEARFELGKADTVQRIRMQ